MHIDFATQIFNDKSMKVMQKVSWEQFTMTKNLRRSASILSDSQLHNFLSFGCLLQLQYWHKWLFLLQHPIYYMTNIQMGLHWSGGVQQFCYNQTSNHLINCINDHFRLSLENLSQFFAKQSLKDQMMFFRLSKFIAFINLH